MKNKIVDRFNHALGLHGFDYSQISDEVYIGTNMCCQFGFAKELLAKGVRADISLEETTVDAAIAWLKEKRPVIHFTEAQLSALRTFEASPTPIERG